MKAMILAAGLGTRLRPLSDLRPKALMPVANRPTLAWNIEYLIRHGVTEIVVNVHHHTEQMLSFLQSSHFQARIEIRVETDILGTGGGIRNTIGFWDHEPFVVMNGDILTDTDLTAALEQHKKTRALATLILHDHPPFNKIRIDATGRITDIPRAYGPEGLAFTGIHILEPDILPHIPEGFSDIVDCYRRLMNEGRSILSYVSRGHGWHDIGSLPDYLRANRALAPELFTVGPGCRIHPAVKFMDWAVIGANCHLEKGAEISRSVLWDGVRVAEERKVADCVVTPEGIFLADGSEKTRLFPLLHALLMPGP
jgi:NDP-sugar pyrophosphorylase family protein